MIEFSEKALEKFKKTVQKYPHKKAVLLPTLWLAQEEFGYLSLEVMEYIAKLLDIPPSKVYSVASFYTMLKKEASGKYLIQVCRTLSCELAGSEEVLEHISNKLGIKEGETTADNKFTLVSVECLGSCGTSPVMKINDEHYENLTKSKINQILDNLN